MEAKHEAKISGLLYTLWLIMDEWMDGWMDGLLYFPVKSISVELVQKQNGNKRLYGMQRIS